MKFKIVADASVDIPHEVMEKYDVSIIPIEVRFGDELYPDGLDTRTFYNKLTKTGLIPKTSMPNSYKFEEFYRPYVNDPDVFVITILISMQMSTTKNQAKMVAESLGMKNVFIEESCTTTIAQGAIIGELCKFIDKCQDIEKIKEEFYRLREKVDLFAVINDLKYLKASGRLSSAGALLGSMLSVKPIVSVVDGVVTNVAKCLGINKAENYILDKLKNVDPTKMICFIHSDCPDKIETFKERALPMLPAYAHYSTEEIGYVVGSHVGAKCYGVVFFNK